MAEERIFDLEDIATDALETKGKENKDYKNPRVSKDCGPTTKGKHMCNDKANCPKWAILRGNSGEY